jgi:hypothetical protein
MAIHETYCILTTKVLPYPAVALADFYFGDQAVQNRENSQTIFNGIGLRLCWPYNTLRSSPNI